MSTETAIWLAIIGAIGGVLGVGGLAVALVQKNRTAAETEEHSANAKVRLAEAESVAVMTLKTAVEEIRKIADAKESQIHALQTDMQELKSDYLQEAERREKRYLAEMHDVRGELRELHRAADAARKAWGVHSQWDWNVYHWAQQQGMEFPEPPPMEW